MNTPNLQKIGQAVHARLAETAALTPWAAKMAKVVKTACPKIAPPEGWFTEGTDITPADSKAMIAALLAAGYAKTVYKKDIMVHPKGKSDIGIIIYTDEPKTHHVEFFEEERA